MTDSKHNVFLFPAFVLKYKGNETKLIEAAGIDLRDRLHQLSELTQTDLTDFDLENNPFIEDELKNQLITYLLSCIFADILQAQHVKPTRLAALSMGLYAALYCARSLKLSEGALLITKIYEKASNMLRNQNHGMLNVIGLGDQEVRQLIHAHRLNCESVIKNGDHSYILAGERDALQQFHVLAEKTGAMHLHFLPVKLPYHTRFLRTFVSFQSEIFDSISVKTGMYPIWSIAEGKWISRPEEIKKEIIQNLYTPIDWEYIMESLNRAGSVTFYECGPGNSMKRMARFFEGSFTIKGLSA